jgi:hypothetical protein
MSADPERDTIRALVRQAEGKSVTLTATVIARRRWASALFEGVRLTIEAMAPESDFDAWLTALPEAELPLRGHFLADAQLIERQSPGAAIIELLVLAED